MKEKIEQHSRVLLHYSIGLTNGTAIESSFDDEPIQVQMGSGALTEGMELALYGLSAGDRQTLTLTPEQGFGQRDEDNIHRMSLGDFSEDIKPEPGLVLSFETAEGDDVPGTVLSIENDEVEIDFNHPLAGRELVFTVEIVEIDNAHAVNDQ